MTTVLAGLALGFAVAAGFGPISVLALTSGLRHGFRPAFGVGLGAALVDGLYALLAALGLAATLANPLTIVSWAAAFTAVVPELDISRTETLSVLPLSVCLGTLTWFTGLAAGAALLGRRLSPRLLRAVSIAAGVVVAVFGVVFIVRGL